ncbi:MAG: GNAT family N-acetyltransferase [Xenococcaceae cyanobacterium]
MEIRVEKLEDIEAIYQVHVAAFGRTKEADLVDILRKVVEPVLSFVAVKSGQIVGHIFFSPVSIEIHSSSVCQILGLAPLAILPQFQRQGIGSVLIRYALKECSRLGFQGVVVLGNPEYYHRFGFVTAIEKGLVCEYSVPDEAFMVLELINGALSGCHGKVKYQAEFASL